MARRVEPLGLQRPLRALRRGHGQRQRLLVVRRVLRRKLKTGGILAAFQKFPQPLRAPGLRLLLLVRQQP